MCEEQTHPSYTACNFTKLGLDLYSIRPLSRTASSSGFSKDSK